MSKIFRRDFLIQALLEEDDNNNIGLNDFMKDLTDMFGGDKFFGLFALFRYSKGREKTVTPHPEFGLDYLDFKIKLYYKKDLNIYIVKVSLYRDGKYSFYDEIVKAYNGNFPYEFIEVDYNEEEEEEEELVEDSVHLNPAGTLSSGCEHLETCLSSYVHLFLNNIITECAPKSLINIINNAIIDTKRIYSSDNDHIILLNFFSYLSNPFMHDYDRIKRHYEK